MSDELSKEETLILKLAEFDIARANIVRASVNLIKSSRRIGSSGHQVAVLRSCMDDLAKECDQLNAIKWPAPKNSP